MGMNRVHAYVINCDGCERQHNKGVCYPDPAVAIGAAESAGWFAKWTTKTNPNISELVKMVCPDCLVCEICKNFIDTVQPACRKLNQALCGSCINFLETTESQIGDKK